MRKFRNKKLATAIILFAMIFVVAGGFAALRRTLHINARVHMFAPQVGVVWESVTLDGDAFPVLWETTDPVTRRGTGVPSAGARFAARTWPTVNTVSLALHDLSVEPVAYPGSGIPGDYLVTRAPAHFGDPSPAGLSVYQQASAWWRISDITTVDPPIAPSTQHPVGMFPNIAHIENQTLVNPMAYTHLDINLVFDNLHQRYDFRVTLGNPGDIALTTRPFSEWESLIVQPAVNTPAREIVTVNWENLAEITILPGETVTRYLSFKAPDWAWLDFFATTPYGESFLDTNFNTYFPGEWTVQVPAGLTDTPIPATSSASDAVGTRPAWPTP